MPSKQLSTKWTAVGDSWGQPATVKHRYLGFDKEALDLWSDRLLLFGKEVLMKAVGIAIMKRQYTVTTDDIKQAFSIQKIGMSNVLPDPDMSDDSDA